MTIFDYLNDILKVKSGTLSLREYQPFMVNKWLSFASPELAEFVNQFNTNVYLENKELHYKLMLTSLPKINKLPRIDYIKKIKQTESSDNINVAFASIQLELSKKEVMDLMSASNLLS